MSTSHTRNCRARRCAACGREFKGWRRDTRFCSLACRDAGRRRSPIDRVLSRISPEPNTGCWLFLGGVAGKHGHGSLGRGGQSEGKAYAHRVVWESMRGAIPAGLRVLHRCDVPVCVNPDHLFLGTDADNVRDAISKGRAWFQNPVTLERAREMRRKS